jgi:hypothetical protein
MVGTVVLCAVKLPVAMAASSPIARTFQRIIDMLL